MAGNKYEQGDVVTFSAIFRDTANALTDVVRPVFILQNPLSASAVYVYQTDPNVVRVSVGTFYATALIPTGSASAAGRWNYWFGSNSGVQQATQDFIIVKKNSLWSGS